MPAGRRARLERTRLNGNETHLVHDFTGFGTTARVAHALEFLGNPSRAIASSMLPEDVLNDRLQLSVGQLAHAWCAGLPGIVGGAADAERFTNVDYLKTCLL